MISRGLTPLALLAAGLALIVPSAALARDSDLLLALLVLATALGVSLEDIAGLRDHARALAGLSVLPFLGLAGFAWGLSRAFTGPIRDGVLACGLSSAEVASVGLVALAGAETAIALAAVAGSLVVAAVLGPVGIAELGGGHADGAALLARFALVVVVPLVAGIAARSVMPGPLARRDPVREEIAALAVVALVYASLSGERGAHHLGSALAASAAFLAGAALVALVYRRRSRGAAAIAGAFTIAMRDFAVAAALATQAFGPAAGVVPGVYGVLMLVGGSAAATALRRGAVRRG